MRKWIFTLFSLLCLVPLAVAQDRLGANIFIVSTPTVSEGDNRISVDVIVRERSGLPVTELTAGSFAVSDLNQDLQVTAERRLPITLAVIIDTTVGSDIDLIQATLRAYVDGYYREGDTLTFYVIDGKTSADFRIINIDSVAEARDEIGKLVSSVRFYAITPTLQRALDDLKKLDSSPTNPRQALFVGSLINDPREAQSSAIFAEAGIPLHVVQAHRQRQNQNTAYRTLASRGGGLYANNLDGSFVLAGETFTAVNTLKVLYDSLNNTRLVYTVSYQSLNQDLTPTRSVTLTVRPAPDSEIVGTFEYTLQFQAPTVEFTDLTQLTPVIRPFRDPETLILGFDKAQQTLNVVVAFPDRIPRKLKAIRLEVKDTVTQTILQSSLIPNPIANLNGTYELTWALADFITPDSLTGVDVSVTVTDEVDLSATVSQQGSVRVNPAPPLPTPTPTATFTPSPTPTPTPVAVTNVTNTATAQNVVGGIDNGGFIAVLTLALMALSVVIVILVLRLRRLRQQQTATMNDFVANTDEDEYKTDAGALEQKAVGNPTETNGVLARLLVKEGWEMVGNVRLFNIEKSEFIIGRNPSECDLVINAPVISPRHCKLSFKDGNYYVRDLNSKNGTFVNGDRIGKDRDTLVPKGSEIGITPTFLTEIWDSDREITIENQVIDTKTGIPSNIMTDVLEMPKIPGIVYPQDTGTPINDEYSPL